MPSPPPGEADLRDHALHFATVEGYVLGLLGMAVTDPSGATKLALTRLAEVRRLDHRAPVGAAYLHEHPVGRPDAVRDLAGSLARRLDTGAETAADGVRSAFRQVTKDNVADLVASSVLTAAVDRAGNHWALGAWADMNCTTIGRQATSRGITDNVGEGGTVTIATGDCSYCAEHSGPAVIGADPLPPYHPNCTCVATR